MIPYTLDETSKKHSMTLNELAGCIANCAIDNEEHKRAHERIQILINKYGPLTEVNSVTMIKALYRSPQ